MFTRTMIIIILFWIPSHYLGATDQADTALTKGSPLLDVKDLFAWYDQDRQKIYLLLSCCLVTNPEASQLNFDRSLDQGSRYSIIVDTNGDFVEDARFDFYFGRINEYAVTFGDRTFRGTWNQPIEDGEFEIFAGLGSHPLNFDYNGWSAWQAALRPCLPDQQRGFRCGQGALESEPENDFADQKTIVMTVGFPRSALSDQMNSSQLSVWAISQKGP